MKSKDLINYMKLIHGSINSYSVFQKMSVES